MNQISGRIAHSMIHQGPPAAVEAVKTSDIEAEMGFLDSSTALLSDLAERLEQRLGTVLQPASPESDGGAVPQAYRVPLADAVRCQRHRVDATNRRLQDLLNRLEL